MAQELITGLFKKEKDGKTRLSGKAQDGTWYTVYTNDYKKKDSDPDYKLYKSIEDKQPISDNDDIPF